MKVKQIGLSGLVVLMSGFLGYSLHAQTPPKGGPHPEIKRAIRALTNAQGFLTKAEHDFAGHREKALDLTDKALKECNLALKDNP